MKKLVVLSLIFVGSVLFILALCPQLTSADNKGLIENFWHKTYGGSKPHTSQSAPSWELLTRAKPDECFYDIGDSKNYFVYPGDLDINACTSDQGQPKTNQAYIWGLAKSGDNLWFGTIANTLCLVLDSLKGVLPIGGPMQTDDWVCESGGKDFRPPRIFVYNITGKALTDMTGVVLNNSADDATRLKTTTGLRSAGAYNNVVFIGGITGLWGGQGVNIFAFRGDTMQYLGSRTYAGYTNIRQWKAINGQLYVGLGKPGDAGPGLGKPSKGEIWRWTGSTDNPFSFETVGMLDADPAYLAGYNDRIFVSTWGTPAIGSAPASFEGASLYMSPLFGSDQRLSTEDANGWTVVWDIHRDYEAEPSAFYYGGAIEAYGSYLYWGTMTIPGAGIQLFTAAYPDCKLDTVGEITAFLGTYRPVHMFRGKDFDKKDTKRGCDKDKRKIELLYGSQVLPKFNGSACKWSIVPNKTGKAPKFGLAGMGNFFNAYAWWGERYRDGLFLGTFDWSYLASAFARYYGLQIPEPIQDLGKKFYGADLYNFISPDKPAVPVSLNGMGNYLNYGIRTMVADDFLYIGTANPMNLDTEPGKPLGGWELYKLGEENAPPVISKVSASPSVLWPPNHKMVKVTVSYLVNDDLTSPSNITCALDVTSNESITDSDYVVVDAHHVKLRAERAGSGDGRIYTITITCADDAGLSSKKNVTVTVPHDQGKKK